MNPSAYRSWPLDWPPHRTRTDPVRRRTAAFFSTSQSMSVTGSPFVRRSSKTPSQAEDELYHELLLLGAKDIVVSSNLVLNRDGSIKSAQAEPHDPGVAVYFTYKGSKMAFASDRWMRAADNLYAIAKTIGAIRGIERWGSGEMVRAAFTGFRAFPLPQRPWRLVFGFSEDERPTISEVDRRHREAAKKFHPDVGSDQIVGSEILMAEINAARDEARRELEG